MIFLIRKLIKIIIYSALLILFTSTICYVIISLSTQTQLYNNINDLPKTKVGIVLGTS